MTDRSVFTDNLKKPTELPAVKLDSVFGGADSRRRNANVSKISKQEDQSKLKPQHKKTLSLIPPYNHYQRPMSQAQDKRLALASSLLSTQRTTDKGINDLKPMICSIPLIDKNEEYEALLKLNQQRNVPQEMSTQVNRDPNSDLIQQNNLNLNMWEIKERGEEFLNETKKLARRKVKVDKSLTLESKTLDDDSLVLKPLRIPITNMETHRIKNANDLHGHGGDRQQNDTETTEGNYISGRGMSNF